MNITNKFESLVQSVEKISTTKHLAQKSNNLYKDKPFYERYSHIYLGSRIISILCNLLSGATASIFLYFVFCSTFGNLPYWLSIGCTVSFTVLIVFVLELIKRKSGEIMFIDMLRYKRIGLSLFISIVCTSISIVSSWYGSKHIPSLTTSPPSKPLELAFNPNEISKEYESLIVGKKQQIEDKKQQIREYTSNNISSRTNKLSTARRVRNAYSKLNNELSSLQKDLSKLSNDKIKAIEQQRLNFNANIKQKHVDYNEALSLYKKETAKYKNTLVVLSCSFEILFWFCYGFIMLYLYKSFIQFNIIDSNAELLNNVENVEFESVSTVEQPNKIGFSMENNSYKVVNVGGINLVEYKGKRYNIQQIKSNISANKSKVKKYRNQNDVKKVDQYSKGAKRWGDMLKALKACY